MQYKVDYHGENVWTITTDQPGPAIARFLAEHGDHEIRTMYGHTKKPSANVSGGEPDLHDITLVTFRPHAEQA